MLCRVAALRGELGRPDKKPGLLCSPAESVLHTLLEALVCHFAVAGLQLKYQPVYPAGGDACFELGVECQEDTQCCDSALCQLDGNAVTTCKCILVSATLNMCTTNRMLQMHVVIHLTPHCGSNVSTVQAVTCYQSAIYPARKGFEGCCLCVVRVFLFCMCSGLDKATSHSHTANTYTNLVCLLIHTTLHTCMPLISLLSTQ